MKFKLLVSTLIAAGALVQATNSIAADNTNPRWYIGASVGQADWDTSSSDVNAAFTSAGFTSASSTVDHTDTGYKLFAGYKFNKNFAVEGGYVDLGKASISATTTGPAANVSASFRARAVNLDAVGILPLNDQFSVFGKVGVYYWDASGNGVVTAGGRTVNLSDDGDGTDFKLGVGAQYDFSKNFGVRIEYERFNKVADEAVNLVTAGVVFRF